MSHITKHKRANLQKLHANLDLNSGALISWNEWGN